MRGCCASVQTNRRMGRTTHVALYFVSEDRESMVTGYFSEPVLVQAAAQLTNEASSEVHSALNKWRVLLKVLLGSLRKGMVDAGFRGELVARVLLLLAWDKCCDQYCQWFVSVSPSLHCPSSATVSS